MLQTRYHLVGSQSEIMLRAKSDVVLAATKLFVKNVTEGNPARAELLNQVALMERSIEDLSDCEITVQKHGYLRTVLLNLFDGDDAELICEDRVYSIDMVEKEYWSDGRLPGHSRGGYGGFLYRANDGQIVLKQGTWIS